MALYETLKGGCGQVWVGLFSHVTVMNGVGFMLCQGRFRLDISGDASA